MVMSVIVDLHSRFIDHCDVNQAIRGPKGKLRSNHGIGGDDDSSPGGPNPGDSGSPGASNPGDSVVLYDRSKFYILKLCIICFC